MRISKSPMTLLGLLSTAYAFVGLIFIPAPSFASGPQGDFVPALLPSGDESRPWPVFVAAEVAVSKDGTVAEQLFHPASVGIIRNMLNEEPEDGCIRVGEAYVQGTNTPAFDSLENVVANTQDVMIGRVVGFRNGFVHGVPGRLLRIEVIQQLKGAESLPYLFVFYPVTEMEVGGQKICKSDIRYPDVPEAGTKLLVLAEELRTESAEPFARLPNNGSGIIVLDRSTKKEGFPRLLRDELRGLSTSEIVERVSVLIRGGVANGKGDS